MSAHAATIFNGLLKLTDDVDFIKQSKSAMSYACGIDDTLGFNFEWQHDFHALYDAIDPVAGQLPDANKAREVMREMLAIIDPVLRHYASHDEFVRVKHEYWKPNTPWAHKRYAKFHTADGFPHSKHGGGAPYSEKGQERYKAISEGRA